MQASRSLRSHQPRAWLRHTPYLRATQTLRLKCRVCAVRTHAVLLLPNDFKPCRNTVSSKRSLGHDPTKSSYHL